MKTLYNIFRRNITRTRKVKKIKNILSIAMVAFIMLNISISLAGNTSDTSWSFRFSRTTFNQYTPVRDKYDASPVYFYVDKLEGNTIKVRVLAGNGDASSYTPYVYINKPLKYCVSSNVYEDGYRKAQVNGQKYNRFSTSTAYGLWSPDSWSCGW